MVVHDLTLRKARVQRGLKVGGKAGAARLQIGKGVAQILSLIHI